MANSLIEDVMNEQPINDGGKNSKQPKNKKSKKIVVVLIILLLVIIVCAVVIFYLSKQKEVTNIKQAFFDALTKNNIEQVSTINLYDEFLEKLVSESSSVETNVDISYSDEDMSINNINLYIDSKNDVENLRAYSNMTLNYSDNELFNLEMLFTDEAFGLKSDEIVTSFVGATYAYLMELEAGNSGIEELPYNLEDDIYDTNTEDDDLIETLNSDAESEISNLENMEFSEESVKIYTDILNKNLDESQFTSKEVTLNMDSGKVDCTEYTLTMTEEEFITLTKELLEGFETDTDSVDIISSIFVLAGASETDLIDMVDELIAQLEEAEIDEDSNIIIKVYDNNGQTVKLAMQYSGITMEIEYLYGDSESSIKITSVEDETGEGLSFKLINKKSDLTQNFNFEISIIEDSAVTTTVAITTEIIKSGSNYTFNLGLEAKSSEIKIVIDSSSEITFTDVDVDELTSENCVLFDDLTEEQQTELINSISERAQEVLIDKMSQLSLIDTNTSPTVIEQNGNTTDDDNDKETAKQDLITAIQNEMTDSLNNGEEYTIQNLEGLEIEGHSVEVELSNDLAVVTVDGYTFNIDSEFNLSE